MRKTKLFSLLMALCLSLGNVWGAVYFEDTFSNVGTGSSGSILPRDGWSGTGTCAPQNNSGVRAGASGSGATMTKTAMTNIEGTVTLKVTVYTCRYNTNANQFTVTATNGTIASVSGVGTLKDGTLTIAPTANAGVTSTTAAASWTDDYKTVFTITGASSSTTISFASNKRVILGPIKIEDDAVLSAVTITNPTQGTISVKNGDATVTSGSSIAQGTELSVSIADVPGYRFTLKAYKTGDPSTVVPITNGKLTMPAYPITITADELALFNVAVAVNDANMGSATINGGTAAIYVDDDDEIALVATPELGYEFVEWTVSDANIVLDKETSASTTALAGASGTITANFQVSASPSVVADPATLAFDNADKGATVDAKSFTINGLNLTGALTVSSSNAVFGFEVTEGSLTPTAGAMEATIAVTPSTANAGIFAGNITISGGGLAEDINVPVSITVMDLYTVSFSTGEGNPTQDPITEAHGGEGITLPAGPTPACSIDDWEFAGWAEAAVATKTTDAPTLLAAGSNYKPASDRTLYAVYSKEEEGELVFDHYEKVTEDPTDWSGTYLLAANTSGTTYYTFTGQNGTNNYGSSEMHTPGTTEKTDWEVTVAKTTNGYSIYHTNSSKYLGLTASSNNLYFSANFTAETYEWVLSAEDGAQAYSYNTRFIECNTGSSYRVACYAGTQKRFYLYKRIEVKSSTTYYQSAPTCSVKYDINIAAGILNGTVEANKDKASEGDEVTLTANPETGYQLGEWIVKDENEDVVTVTNNKFTMPGSEVLVSATFTQINYTVTMAQTGGASATISDDQTNKHYGDEISISATAVDGYYFLGWEATPAVTFADAKALATTFTMPNSNVEVTAKYAEILTVAEAAALINEDHSATHPNSVVEGYVAGDISFNSKYSSITYNIQAIDANGFLTGSTIKVYSGKGLNNADFSSADDVKVGAKVRVLGELMWYSTDEVYEINYNNYQLSYVEAANPAVVVYGEATKTAYDAGDAFEFDGLNAKTVYENGYAEAIANPSWEADPEIIAANTTSVAVTATYDEKTSAPYNVNVTVNTYAVTLTAMENGSIKQGSTIVETGNKFAAGTELTVTPATDYVISSVLVQNGAEEDVTAAVYENGVITMPAYSITITATFAKSSTAVENVESSAKAVKVLKNGILLIEKANKTYNAQGQLVK